MDKLFDCLNGETADCQRGKPHLTNLTDKSPHLPLFAEMIDFFEKMEFVNCTNCPSKQGWIWTLKGIMRIFNNLKNKHGIKSLATRRLQQDPIENLFGTIRANCGSNYNPNISQFIGALKTAVLSNLAHMDSRSGNCETDNYLPIFTDHRQILATANIECPESEQEIPPVSDMLSSIESSFEESLSDSGEIQACAYVCGFLLKNMKNNNCKTCEETLKCQNMSDPIYNFIKYKEYNDIKNSLKYASKDLINCVENCATKINKLFLNSSHSNNIKKKSVHEILENVNFSFLKKCLLHHDENVKFITNSVFHICVKRYCSLKNRLFVEHASATRKLNILKHK